MDQHKKQALHLAVARLEELVGKSQEALGTIRAILDNPAVVQLPVDDAWPEASESPEETTEDEKIFRAKTVVAMLRERTKKALVGQRVLDFGCGDGHIAVEMATEAKQVVAYDIHNPQLSENENVTFTINRQLISDNSPYDLIVLYDVLDHLEQDDPQDIMDWLATLLADNGIIYACTHPWTSRDGAHLANNKAFYHLLMSKEELAEAGVTSPVRIVRPHSQYEKMFSKAKLRILSKRPATTNVEPFFSGDLLQRVVRNTWEDKIDTDTALRIMAINRIWYILTQR